MSTSTKTWYPTKAAWARAKAAEFNRQVAEFPRGRPGDWRQASRLRAAAARLQRQADAYLVMAVRFEALRE